MPGGCGSKQSWASKDGEDSSASNADDADGGGADTADTRVSPSATGRRGGGADRGGKGGGVAVPEVAATFPLPGTQDCLRLALAPSVAVA